jgi:hypothetical protein
MYDKDTGAIEDHDRVTPSELRNEQEPSHCGLDL